jgi:glycosyltransferase involved in cell wall biosynthesis
LSFPQSDLFSRRFSSDEIRAFAAARQATAASPPGHARTRLSVVLPSFNQARFLRRTLNTIANQHYGNLQLIVMDGGSSDGSQAIIDEFHDIVSHSESGPDGGQAAAINKGFRRADGDFVAWQNSDDLYLPGFFQAIDAAVTLNPHTDLIVANSYVVDPEDRILWATKYGPFSRRYLAYVGWNMTSQSVFVRRGLAQRVGPLPHLNVAFDYDWFLRVAAVARHVVELKRYGGCYRIHPESKFSTADARAREALDLRVLADLGYRVDPDRPLARQWMLRRSALQAWQRLNQVMLYGERTGSSPFGSAWASLLHKFRPGMLGYASHPPAQT